MAFSTDQLHKRFLAYAPLYWVTRLDELINVAQQSKSGFSLRVTVKIRNFVRIS